MHDTANAGDATANADAGDTATGNENQEQQTLDQLKSTAARLLAESKKYKADAAKAKKEKDDLLATQAQEQGRYKDLYEKSKVDMETFKKQLKLEKVNGAVKSAAEKAGFVYPEKALKYGNAELLQYNEDSFEVHGVETFLDDLKKDVPQLFQQNKNPVINPATPSGSAIKLNKPVKEMTSAEIIAQIKALK